MSYETNWQRASRETNERLSREYAESSRRAVEATRRRNAEAQARDHKMMLDMTARHYDDKRKSAQMSADFPQSFGGTNGADSVSYDYSNAKYMLWFVVLLFLGFAVLAVFAPSSMKPEPQVQDTKKEAKEKQIKPKAKEAWHTDENCIKWQVASSGSKQCTGWLKPIVITPTPAKQLPPGSEQNMAEFSKLLDEATKGQK